jgi:hypothetical protein
MMCGDDYHGYGLNKLKDGQRRHPDVSSDADSNSADSDIDEESLPVYKSPEAEPTTVFVAWPGTRSPSPSTDNSDDCVVRISRCIFVTFIEALLQVCRIRPKHPPYPTCGMTCAAKLKASGVSYPTRVSGFAESPNHLGGSNNSGGPSYSGSSGGPPPTCVVSAVSLLATESGLSHFICGQVCGVRPSYSNGNRKYPTCGLACKKKYEASGGSSRTGGPSPSGISGLFKNLTLGRNSVSTGSPASTASSVPTRKPGMCVVSSTHLRYATTYVLLCI